MYMRLLFSWPCIETFITYRFSPFTEISFSNMFFIVFMSLHRDLYHIQILFAEISFSNMFFHILGKFRHLPVVENGEVIAMLDIAKCLYDAISRLEKAAEQGSAIAAAVEGVERQLGSNFSGLPSHNMCCQLIHSF
jgi:hypothetical protein